MHVSFVPKTGGGSAYYTRDETMQAALERNPRFNKIFHLAKTVDESVKPAEKKEAPKKEPKVLTLEFRNNDDAKEYIADKFGISRSKLRSRAQLDAAAKAHNIEIVWLG